MSSHFERCHGTFAVYRLTAPLPITVDAPWGQETLRVDVNDWPPPAAAYLRNREGDWHVLHFQSAEHAAYTFGNGFRVEVRSRVGLFFAQLAREGRAEIVAGPHSEIRWLLEQGVADGPALNAYHNWRTGTSVT